MAWPTTTPTRTNYDQGTDSPQLARQELADLWQHVVDMINARGVADGVASLDSTGKVPSAQIPDTGFPTGTKMVFYQASVPSGWQLDATINDRLLRVVSGTGGGTGGSWTISGLTVAGTALTVSQLPAHTHGAGTISVSGGSHSHPLNGSTFGGANGSYNVVNFGGTDQKYTSTQSSSHSHTVSGSTAATGSDATHTHGISHDANWRPAYADVIVGTKL